MLRLSTILGLTAAVALTCGCAKRDDVDDRNVVANSAALSDAEYAIDNAALTALYGPEATRLRVMGHEFNVKMATIEHVGSSTTIRGQLSHHLSYRPDDQVYFVIRLENSRLDQISTDTHRGGLAPIVGPIAAVIADYFDVPIDGDMATSALRAIGASIDGAWESVADAIVTDAGFKAAALHL